MGTVKLPENTYSSAREFDLVSQAMKRTIGLLLNSQAQAVKS